MENKKLLQLVSDIGFDMLSYGGEIYRVEETVKRICFAYGVDSVDVFAIPSTIIVSIAFGEETLSWTRRLASKGTDLDKVDRLNNLSRRLCVEKPDYDEARRLLWEVQNGPGYPLWVLCCAHGVAALIFALFFGGNWKDGLWAFPIGVMIKLVSYGLGKLNANSFFVTVICGAMSAFMAALGIQLHVLNQVSHVLMGAIMNLVPGLMLTNAMRDIMAEDFIAGLMRISEAVLIGTGIAVGVMVPLSFFQSMLGTSGVCGDFLTCLYAAVGVLAFGVIFNLREKKLLLSALGGMVSWLAYLLTAHWFSADIFGYFFAAVIMSVYAEVFARIYKTPVTIYLVAGLIPLVPGSGIYHTMEYCVIGENQLFWETGLYTLEIAAVIGFAMICVSSIVRICFSGRSMLRQKRERMPVK